VTDAESNELMDGQNVHPSGRQSPQGDSDTMRSPGTANRFLPLERLRGQNWSAIRGSKWVLLIEVAFVALWALYFTRPYRNMDTLSVPGGREYLAAIKMHTVWERAQDCGLCALWYGNLGGGFPAVLDPAASTLHPLVMVTTLLWGVVNGSKLALIAIFIMAGLGQWWQASVLGLRWPSRIWGGAMAVVAGYLAARMELGAFSLVLSTATAVLVFPAIIELARAKSMKAVVVLAVILALIAVGGNGYVQVGLVFTLPAGVFLVPWERQQVVRFLRRFAIAVGLALLLAAPFLIPFMHFLPSFSKDFDVSFKGAQPFAYVPLNLVIRDMGFYLSDVLEKLPWPSHFANYVGWIPILLALLGLFRARSSEERRAVAFLGFAALLALWTASGTPLMWLVKIVKVQWFSQLIGGVRYTSFIAGLAIPPIIGMAAIGLDQLLDVAKWRIHLSLRGEGPVEGRWSFDIRWLLVIPLVISLNQARNFSKTWITTVKIDPSLARVLAALHTPSLEWVNVPLGEHFFVEPAIAEDLKLSNDFSRTWHWRDRPLPQPVLEANRDGPPAGMAEKTVVEGVHIHAVVDRQEYAAVMHPDGSQTACSAHGTGANIDVSCSTARTGSLVVEENSWSGWRVSIDGEPARLREEDWLSVEAPPGEHTYSFRYRPWDVALGIALLLVGVVASSWLLWRSPQEGGIPPQATP